MGASTRMGIGVHDLSVAHKEKPIPSRVGVSGLAPWEFQFSCAPPCLMGDTNNLQRMMDKWLI